MENDNLLNILTDNSTLARELYLPCEIKRVSSLTPLEFLRDYVSKNIPVIFTDIACNWKACALWDFNYLENIIGNNEITVSQTPNGRADAVLSLSSSNYPILDNSNLHKQTHLFVMPHDEKMKFKDFIHLLKESKNNDNISYPISYIQYQNSNFTSEFTELYNDIDFSSLSFADDVFGCKPDAINFWMGDNNSVSSLHKDHYENIYAVIKGTKKFLLYPPTDRPFIKHELFHSAIYTPIDNNNDNTNISFIEKMKSRTFGISNISKDITTPWISIDPNNPNINDNTLLKYAKPIECKVNEGEILYLPSLYFHQVSQQSDNEGKIIAVNLWYDMQYDIKYNYFSLLENITKIK